MQSELHCMHCGHCSYKFEPFLDISLSLEMAPPVLQGFIAPPISDLNSNLNSSLNSNLNGSSTDEEIPKEVSEIDLTSDPDEINCEINGEVEIDVEVEVEVEVDGSSLEESSVVTPPTPIRNRSLKEKDDGISISLSQCLQHFTSLETLSEQVHCDTCQQQRPSKKRLSLSSVPKVLILHFKRFDSLRNLKICSKVDFPLRGLDLGPFMQQQHGISSSSSKLGNNGVAGNLISLHHPTQSTPLLYDLQGLVNHKGSLTQVLSQFTIDFFCSFTVFRWNLFFL